MSRRSRSNLSSNPVIAILQKDQFGSLWLSLLFLAVLISKWFVLSPVEIEGEPCVACVVALIWAMMLSASILITTVWTLWTDKVEKGIGLMFALLGSILGIVWLIGIFTRGIVEKFYQSGVLYWPEASVTFLVDDMVNHSIGLFLATAVIYAMLRLMFCKDLSEKKIVIPISLCVALAASGLLFLGIKLY